MKKQLIRILLIENESEDIFLLKECFEKGKTDSMGFHVKACINLAEGIDVLCSETFDVIILDLELPDSQGLDTLRSVLAVAGENPIVVLTYSDGKTAADQAVAIGAQDYLFKEEITGELLSRSIRYAVGSCRNPRDSLRLHGQDPQKGKDLSSIVEHIGDGVVVADDEGIVRYVSPSAEKILGEKGSELAGKLFGYPLVNGESTEINFLSKDKKIIVAEMRVGRTRWDGREAFLAVIRDITDRKNAENQTRKSKTEWEITFDAMPDVVMLLDRDYKIIRANKALTNLLGLPFREIIGKHCFHLLHRTAAPCLECPYSQTLMDSGEHTVEMNNQVLDRHFLVSTTPRMDGNNGEVAGAIHIMRDITEHKRLEEELLKTNKLESLGLLAGGIAHDFNNILTGVIANLSIAKLKGRGDKELMEIIGETEQASMRAKDLTRQLLTFAKGGAPVKKAAQIGELVKDTAEFAVSGSNVRCECSIPKDLWQAEVDTGQISQVIENLVINAKHVMPHGGAVTVSVANLEVKGQNRPTLKRGKYLRITVQDEGVGIPKEHLSRIFDPYFTTKQDGSGLGLSTAYSILKKHDGYIDVQSELGKGTTFHVCLPATEWAETIRKEKKKRILKGKGKILLMDDEESILRITGKLLKTLNYEAEFVRSGEEAIEHYRNARANGKSFDAVIMDLTIPDGMGGKEAIQRLLEIDPQARGIVSSGYSNDPILAEYEKYGFKGVVTKPFTVEDLSEALAQVLGDE